MVISDTVKSMFVKDYDIPIVLFKEPFFSDRIELYNSKFNTVQKWNNYVKAASVYETIDEYRSEYLRVTRAAVKQIHVSSGYKAFVKAKNLGVPDKFANMPRTDIFTKANIGSSFVEIGVRRSNFSSLQTFDSKIFGTSKTWEEFISNFTENQNIINSKDVRRNVLNECNPRQQVIYTRYLLSGILNQLSENGVDLSNVIFGNSIIFDVTSFSIENKYKDWSEFFNILSKTISACGFPVQLDAYSLFGVKKNDEIIGYIKQYADQSIMEFKNLDHITLPLVLRTLKQEMIRASDLIFEYNGELATYVKAPKIEIISSPTQTFISDLLTHISE